MKYCTLLAISLLSILCSFAIDGKEEYRNLLRTPLDKREISTSPTLSMVSERLQRGNSGYSSKSRKVSFPHLAGEISDSESFIFDPEGEEKMFCMSLYSYDQTNSKFVHAQSLKSQVRYSTDGKTVYFKDLTKSLGVKTWLKGEQEGDTIRVEYGQPLAYYRNRYLIFFVPMIYDDNTGEMEVQDYYKLVVKGDSLIQPALPEGTFQAAVGYVFISEQTQGSLSLDIDHNMELVHKEFIQAPEDVEPVEYVYTFTNSYGNIYKKKVNVKKKGEDFYMQLSTSAPDCYIKGTILPQNASTGGEEVCPINIESGQLITDSTFLYYYSLADPVYDESGEVTDFTPTSEPRLSYNPTTQAISFLPTSEGQEESLIFSVDYLSGMEQCMDYIMNPELTPYGGDVIATPANPIWRSVYLDGGIIGTVSMNYMSFVLPTLDVDSNYINPDLMSYRIYINDSLYEFKPVVYKYLSEAKTEIPYTFDEGYDFRTYDQLHYIYIYEEKEDIKSIGIQSIYTVGQEKRCSEIVTKTFDSPIDPDDPRKDYDLTLTSCRMEDILVKVGEEATVIGIITNNGKNTVKGFNVTCATNGKNIKAVFLDSLEAGKSTSFDVSFPTSETAQVGERQYVEVKVGFDDDFTDSNPADNDTVIAYGIYTESFAQKNVLLEEFTSESCGWCPYGAYRIHTAIEEEGLQNNAIWVCHHEGFGVDWLTVDASTEYTALYGDNTFAPAWMLDRNQKYSEEDYPVHSIPDIDNIKSSLLSATEEPAFVRIGIENNFDSTVLESRIKVEKSIAFDVQCQNPRLTVFLVEDSIHVKRQKCYDSHTLTYHHNALRKVLTPVWGQELKWADDGSSTAEIVLRSELSEDWARKNLKVVAFVHEYNEDVNQRRVFNSAIENADAETGITGDANGDNVVDIADVNAILNVMFGSTENTKRADVNKDGVVDIADVNAVLTIMFSN